MKKFLALLLTVAMVGSLTACGGSSTEETASESTEAAAETTESEELAAAVDVNGSEDTESDAAPDICCMAENTSNMWESASGSVLFPFPSNGMASGGSICRIVCIFSII